MDVSVLSVLGRLDTDPWAEATRLANLPRVAAVDSLTATIVGLPSGDWSQAEARATAQRLIPLLRVQPHPSKDVAPVVVRLHHRRTATLLIGFALGSVLGATLTLATLSIVTSPPTATNAPPRVSQRPIHPAAHGGGQAQVERLGGQ